VSATVWTLVQLPGWHRWPDAPPHRDYLSVRHRHLFHVRVEVQVRHDDRDVEFHDLADAVRDWWPADGEFGSASCERIGAQLGEHLLRELLLVACVVDVSEDGESGARVNVKRWP